MKPEVIAPGLPTHQMIERAIEQMAKQKRGLRRREYSAAYNILAKEYNRAPPGAYLPLPDYIGTTGNLRRILEGRGLVRGEDFEVHRVTADPTGAMLPPEAHFVAVQKLTVKEMRVVPQ